MLRVALLVGIMFCGLLCPPAMAESQSDTRCPKNPLAASKLATQDVQKFKKMYYSGTWTGFLHQFRTKYAACPAAIRGAYLDTARQLMNAGAPRVKPFQNSLKK